MYQGKKPTQTTMYKQPLNTCIPSPTRWFNRVYTLVYAVAIFAIVYHHCCNLIYNPSFATIFLLVADLVLAFMWALSQAFFLNPVHHRVFVENLPRVVKESEYLGLDVFICTADPFKEPPVGVVSTVLSVLAYEYPTDKLSVYVSDDGWSQVTLFALMEAAKFARHWVPYCRKHDLLDRSPEVYFLNHQLLLPDAVEIKAMYEGMKGRIEKFIEGGILSFEQMTDERWMKTLNKWTSDFTSKDHPAIIEILLDNDKDNDITCHSLPNLIYVSREKNKAIDHHFKAGALNTLIRVSAVITNAPIFLVLDCDMYSNNPNTTLYALCHFMDPNVDMNLAFVQFPQCFHDINNNDTYGAELLFDNRSNPRGMDGLLGVMFSGSGGFLKRQALLGWPKLFDPSHGPKAKTHNLANESTKIDDVLQRAHNVARSRFEENTPWGLEIGFRYGSLVEDVNTSFMLHCRGWTSVYCDPERAPFLGNSPKSLNDILNQSRRWCVGLLEMAMSKHNPITYVLKFMNPLHALCYAYYNFWAFWAIPIVIYAFLPQLALINSSPIFPKVSDPWFLLYAFLFFVSYAKNLHEFMLAGGTFVKWWNNQRIWLILGCSSYPFAIADWVLKSLGLSTTKFIVTSKVTDDELIKRYNKCLFEFGVESPLFLTISIAAVVNLLSFTTGVIQVVRKERFEELCAQLFIVGFAVVNSWPIYDAMVLRSDKGKMPMIITLKAISVALVIFYASY